MSSMMFSLRLFSPSLFPKKQHSRGGGGVFSPGFETPPDSPGGRKKQGPSPCGTDHLVEGEVSAEKSERESHEQGPMTGSSWHGVADSRLRPRCEAKKRLS